MLLPVYSRCCSIGRRTSHSRSIKRNHRRVCMTPVRYSRTGTLCNTKTSFYAQGMLYEYVRIIRTRIRTNRTIDVDEPLRVHELLATYQVRGQHTTAVSWKQPRELWYCGTAVILHVPWYIENVDNCCCTPACLGYCSWYIKNRKTVNSQRGDSAAVYGRCRIGQSDGPNESVPLQDARRNRESR